MKEVALIGCNLDYIASVRGARVYAAYREGHALNELTALWRDEEQDGSEKTAGLGFSLGDNHGFRSKTAIGKLPVQAQTLLLPSLYSRLGAPAFRPPPQFPAHLWRSAIDRQGLCINLLGELTRAHAQ